RQTLKLGRVAANRGAGAAWIAMGRPDLPVRAILLRGELVVRDSTAASSKAANLIHKLPSQR
ncbi:MAG: hypothetical protein WCJ14_12195, partial [Verrucomicrobiota bacterium]